MPAYPGFIGGSAPSQSVIATSERTMNFYVETIGTQGPQNKTALYPTPGQSPWITAAAGITDIGGRGGQSIPGAAERALVVIGGGLYEPTAGGAITRIASVVQDANPAQLSYNGSTGLQALIASGTNGYLMNLSTNVVSQVLTGDASQIGMLDEYFLALNHATGKLRLSNLNDGTTWDPLQFALRSSQPDPWVALGINAPDIWLLGEQTGEIWYDAGSAPFPLAQRTGLTIPFGTCAPFSLVNVGGQMMWLAKNKDGAGVVIHAEGYNTKIVSTTELNTALSTYQRTSRITDAEAYPYQQEGHTFYVLRFPSANATWVYDLTTGIWHERGTWNSAQNRYDTWHPRFHLYAFGQHLVGESSTGAISILDVTYGTEADGSAIRRLRRGPVLIQDNRRIPLRRFELGLETGLGLATGQGSDPQVMFRASSDGGHTWSSERSASAGRIGEYRRRVFWLRLGSPRLWVPEVVMSDPTPWRITDAYLNNDSAAQAA